MAPGAADSAKANQPFASTLIDTFWHLPPFKQFFSLTWDRVHPTRTWLNYPASVNVDFFTVQAWPSTSNHDHKNNIELSVFVLTTFIYSSLSFCCGSDCDGLTFIICELEKREDFGTYRHEIHGCPKGLCSGRPASCFHPHRYAFGIFHHSNSSSPLFQTDYILQEDIWT